MQRVTITIDEPLAAAFDEFLEARGYDTRSEGVRDMVRQAVREWRDERGDAPYCVANLSYIYNRSTRDMAQRLSEAKHENHDLVTANMQVHLDHDHSMETLILRGPAEKVRAFADRIRTERGVSFGSVNIVAVDRAEDHQHPGAHEHSGHPHLHPVTG